MHILQMLPRFGVQYNVLNSLTALFLCCVFHEYEAGPVFIELIN